jgi:predicted secreted protein
MRGGVKASATLRSLLAAVALGAASAPSITGAQLAVQTTDSGAAMRVVVGAARTIRLPETLAGGYRWTIDPMTSANLGVVRVVDLGTARPPLMGALMGAPGMHSWRVRGLAVGTARLSFVYVVAGDPTTLARRHLATIDVRLR